MRTISLTAKFKRDYKREKKGRSAENVEALKSEIERIVDDLASDRPLDRRHRDHPLSGRWKDCRDCHVRPDLILIYRKPDSDHPDKPDSDRLELLRLGSHSKLGL